MQKEILFSIIISALLLFPLSLSGQRQLSEKAQISVLTSSPYEGAVFTVYGHASFRVCDPVLNLDVIFNYGVFDFSKPNFIYRFAKGETDYILGTADYLSYVTEYQMRGSDVIEQVLNLTAAERDKLWTALVVNARPENRMYRYNFFFDNCATRLPAMVEKSVNGTVEYHDPPEPQSFREIVNYCMRNHPWLIFGCDIALGSPADRIATPHEMLFIPYYMMDAFGKATVKEADGTERKLVTSTSTIEAAEADDLERDVLDIFTPLVCGWLLFFGIGIITFLGWRKKRSLLLIDILLFTVVGVAGVVLFFLCFVSEHPAIWPNWSIVWLHPFHLLGVVLFSVKICKRGAFYYHFINFAALILLLAGWLFIPQQFNAAFLPLIMTLALRSWHGICTLRIS